MTLKEIEIAKKRIRKEQDAWIELDVSRGITRSIESAHFFATNPVRVYSVDGPKWQYHFTVEGN